MFYTATKEQIEQLHPELINFEPNKTRCFYKYDNGEIRFFDRLYNYYFSDRPWGLEQEYLAEGLDQQWVDKKDYLSLNIRNTHKAPDGWTFVCLDYSAEEIRLGAINTGCKLYTDAFLAGKDIHTLVGEQTWGYDTYHSNKKKYRKMAKILNFNMQYGGTAFGAARLLNCSLEEAEDTLNKFKSALQDHFGKQDAQVRKTHQTLCEHTFFGLPIRLHRYYASNSYKDISQGERLAKNCRIQGCLPYDAMVLTNHGYLSIGELYEKQHKGIKVWTGDSWTDFIPCYMGKAIKYKITLKNGQTFYCDERHKVKVFDKNEIKWKCVTNYDDNFETLKIGDNICLNKNIPINIDIKYNSLETHVSGNGAYMKDLYLDRQDILDMCYIYGSILGDGRLDYYKEKIRSGIWLIYGYTKFCNIKRVTDFLDKIGETYKIESNFDRPHERRTLTFGHTCLLKAFSELFDYKENQNCYTKRLSKKIFTFDNEMIRQLLLGLYHTDGTKFNKSGMLHLCNRGLLEDVQLLLTLVGFKSEIIDGKSGKDFTLYIYGHKGRDYTTWLETGKFESSSQDKILDYHRNLAKSLNTDSRLTDSQKVLLNRVKRGGSCSLSMFREISSKLDFEFEDYNYSEVISIESMNEEIDTYELTVKDKRQQFVCEGIINHNTGADILSIAFMRLWKDIWNELGNPEDYIRFQITVHDEIDFLVRNDVLQVLVPRLIKNMTIQMPEWKIPLSVGLSLGPTFGQQYEWNYGSKEEGFKLLGPALEEAKKPNKEEKKEESKEPVEEIKIEF